MKRYLVFCGDDYYPIGGMNDFKGDYDTLKECEILLEKEYNDNVYEWTQIWDSKDKKFIKNTYVE